MASRLAGRVDRLEIKLAIGQSSELIRLLHEAVGSGAEYAAGPDDPKTLGELVVRSLEYERKRHDPRQQ